MIERMLFITGFLCFAIICQESRPGCRDAKKSHCVRTVDKALEKITCSNNKVVKELPPLIDTKPKILNMSHNTYVSIGAANLAKLGSLERLFMSKIKHCDGQPIALETLFEPLKNLIELDISNLKIATKTLNISWPPKLKILNIAEMDINDVDGLQGLRHLMQLDARNNNLKVFPALNTSAPLEYINLEDNPLNLIEVSEVAPFCHLKSLGIRITKGGDLESERKYCTCMKLEKWLDKYVPDKNGLTCFRPKNKKSVPKCNGSIFADSDIRARLECQKDQASIFELLFYAIFFCILFPLFYFANEAYNNRMARKQQMAQTPEKSRRRKRKKIITTTSSPHFSETNPNEYEENFEKYNEEIVSLSA